MPFGQKSDLKSGVLVDFDQIYNEAIKPAIEQCGLDALLGDEERTGGIIHSAMFARLLLSEFVVADLTLANANVFYELGIRHAAKPFTTVSILANVSADQLLSLALNTFWHFIEDIGRLMHPAPLLGYWTIFFLQGNPESKRTVANGQLRRAGK
jgi:hypothetical protein